MWNKSTLITIYLHWFCKAQSVILAKDCCYLNLMANQIAPTQWSNIDWCWLELFMALSVCESCLLPLYRGRTVYEHLSILSAHTEWTSRGSMRSNSLNCVMYKCYNPTLNNEDHFFQPTLPQFGWRWLPSEKCNVIWTKCLGWDCKENK